VADLDGIVGGLPVPEALLQTIHEGRWKPPAKRLLAEVFADDPIDPRFYDVSEMLRQNQLFQSWSQRDLYDHLCVTYPGIGVDPALAVIIGDLGTDSPIVLDYRLDRDRPRVLHLRVDGWREVAPDVEALVRLLGL
jgi:hypothetical protein